MADETLLDPNLDPNAGDPPPRDPPAGGPPPADPNAGDPPAEDWRSQLSGGDEKLLGFLGRYQSPKAFVEAAKKDRDAAHAKTAIKLPDNPTDEELAAYRKENGIPEAPEGYLASLPEGLVVGEDDKPFVDQFLAKMHGVNAPPGVTNAALETYYDIVENQVAELNDKANAAKNESIETLREEWGPDYKRNLTVMHGYLDTLPEEVANAFRTGKDANGVPLGYNSAVLKWLTAQALENNPVATVVPGAGANQASAIADEMAALQKEMGNRNSGYWKGPEAAKKQARFRELAAAAEKLK